MDFLAFQVDKLQKAGASLIAPGSIFSLPQLATALAIAFAFLCLRQKMRRGAVRPRAILRAMAVRHLLFNRSTYADLFYYVVNTFAIGTLIGWGILSGSTVRDTTVDWLRASFGAPAPSHAPEWVLRAALTAAVFLAYEFGYYLDHYLKHKIPFLWAFHKTHHSAEVLTPLTVFRVHPIDTLIFVDILALCIGLCEGLFAYAAGRSISLYLIDGTNIITVGCLFLLAQLQHSQFWIPLRGVAGRLILSPAHHQIHHSMDPAHYNRNLGSFVAIFDWMFGTLSVPEKQSPRLRFGVVQTSDDPHRIGTLLIDPIGESLTALGIPLARRRGETAAPSDAVKAAATADTAPPPLQRAVAR